MVGFRCRHTASLEEGEANGRRYVSANAAEWIPRADDAPYSPHALKHRQPMQALAPLARFLLTAAGTPSLRTGSPVAVVESSRRCAASRGSGLLSASASASCHCRFQ